MRLKPLFFSMAVAIASLPLVTAPANAGVSGLFGNMASYQATSPGAFKGQTMNHFSGGSLSWRVPQKNYQLVSMSPPRVSAGCGGIDLYGGSFSFINSEQLVEMLQNIGNNAVGLIFKLALDAVSPQLGGVMDYMNDLAQKINALNVNSCQAAEGILNAAPDVLAGKTSIKDLGMYGQVEGIYEDVSQGFEKIGKNIDERKKAKKSLKDGQNPDFYDKFRNINFTWHALSTTKFNGNQKLSKLDAQIMVSLFGAVLCSDADMADESAMDSSMERKCVYDEPGKAALNDFFDGKFMLKAGGCDLNESSDPGHCMGTTYSNETEYKYGVGGSGNDFNNFASFIQAEMLWLKDKIENRETTFNVSEDGGMSEADRAYRIYQLINMSSVPAWAIVKLASLDAAGDAYFKMTVETIAADIAYVYVVSLAKTVSVALKREMNSARYIASDIDSVQIKAQLDEVKATVKAFERLAGRTKQDFQEIGSIAQAIKTTSDAFAHRISVMAR